MGCKDGFHSSGIIVKVVFFIVFVSMFCNWLAFTTNSWRRVDTPLAVAGTTGTGYYGLWRVCVSASEFTCGQTDGTSNIHIGVTQAFAIMGFMCQNIGFLLIVLFMFKNSCMGNCEMAMASAVLLIISAVGWLIAVAVFGGYYTDSSEDLHYSYGLAVVACVLGLIGGILMLFGSRGHGSVGSK